MNYISTNGKMPPVSFTEAVNRGLAPDGGLFFPSKLPALETGLDTLAAKSFSARTFSFLAPFMPEIPDEVLSSIIDEVFNFPIITHEYDEQLSILELFHGPTLAFKDFGARFLSRVLSYQMSNAGKECVILVATSGDTGSAVADAFFKVPGTRVIILYPEGKVSALQEKQLTTYGENIYSLCVRGNFDDCQALVKTAFVDKELSGRVTLSSANSINIARLFPQSIYYIESAIQALKRGHARINFIVPSGNLGNISAGLIAKKVFKTNWQFTAAMNENAVFHRYLLDGELHTHPSIPTLSNAMDVGNPSNLSRIITLYGNNHSAMQQDIKSSFCNDTETIAAMQAFYKLYGDLIDPHTAVGYNAYTTLSTETNSHCIIAGTAHPAKFAETIASALGVPPPVHQRLQRLEHLLSKAITMESDYGLLKDFILEIAR